MSLSYSFLGGLAELRDFPFRKRAWSRPDPSGWRTPLAPSRKRRLLKHSQHPLHDLLALFVAMGLGEDRQEGVEGVLRLREAKLARIQVQCRARLIRGRP